MCNYTVWVKIKCPQAEKNIEKYFSIFIIIFSFMTLKHNMWTFRLRIRAFKKENKEETKNQRSPNNIKRNFYKNHKEKHEQYNIIRWNTKKN